LKQKPIFIVFKDEFTGTAPIEKKGQKLPVAGNDISKSGCGKTLRGIIDFQGVLWYIAT